MSEEIKEFLQKGIISLEAAQGLIDDGYYDFAASRAYYELFYAVEALLLKKELSFSKHKGVLAAFSEHYVKTGIFPQTYHKILRRAFDIRMTADYGSRLVVTQEEAVDLVKRLRK